MIRVGFCDDEAMYLKYMMTLAEEQLKQNNLAYDLLGYDSGLKLLEEYKDQRLDLIFLDIEMPEIDGLVVAEKLRQWDTQVMLVLVTSKEDRVYDAFGYNIYKFIRKSLSLEAYKALFKECFDQVHLRKSHYLFNTSEGRLHLKEDEIIYIETSLRKFYLQTKHKRYRIVAESFNEIFEGMERHDFLMAPNRSCLVNLRHVKEITKSGDVVIQYGEEQGRLPISRGRRKEILHRFLQYIK